MLHGAKDDREPKLGNGGGNYQFSISLRRTSLGREAFCFMYILSFVGGCSEPEAPESNRPFAAVTQQGSRIRYPATGYPELLLPNAETRVVRSVLNIKKPMMFGEYVWDEVGIPAGITWVRIDLGNQTLSVFRAGHEIGSTVILYGTDGKPTPTGIFPVLSKARSHQSTLYDAQMPFMLRLTGDGVAIHASKVREGSATHGCIGVPLTFAELLYGQIRQGDQVVIMPPGLRNAVVQS